MRPVGKISRNSIARHLSQSLEGRANLSDIWHISRNKACVSSLYYLFRSRLPLLVDQQPIGEQITPNHIP